jgi:ferredoxin-NADP reductase/ferredoxin
MVSGFVHSTLRAGTTVEVAAPRGTFVLAEGSEPVVLISAGIGATPVLAMLHVLADAGSQRDIWWLHGARNSAEHPFAAEVRALLTRLPNARTEICYSAPLSTDVPGRDYDHPGHLTAEFLQGLGLPGDGHAYICGPQKFMDDIRSALQTIGFSAAHISTEVFGAGPAITPGIAAAAAVAAHQPVGPPGTGPDITFARSGLTAPWRDDVGSLLEFAEACDVPTRWSCRTGICHTCESGLLSGRVSYEPAPIDLPAEGNVLICCATPRDDLVIDL